MWCCRLPSNFDSISNCSTTLDILLMLWNSGCEVEISIACHTTLVHVVKDDVSPLMWFLTCNQSTVENSWHATQNNLFTAHNFYKHRVKCLQHSHGLGNIVWLKKYLMVVFPYNLGKMWVLLRKWSKWQCFYVRGFCWMLCADMGSYQFFKSQKDAKQKYLWNKTQELCLKS